MQCTNENAVCSTNCKFADITTSAHETLFAGRVNSTDLVLKWMKQAKQENRSNMKKKKSSALKFADSIVKTKIFSFIH